MKKGVRKILAVIIIAMMFVTMIPTVGVSKVHAEEGDPHRVTVYNVPEDPNCGTVSIDPEWQTAHRRVEVTVNANEGYTIGKVIYEYTDSEGVTHSDIVNGTQNCLMETETSGTFWMPDYPVQVYAFFDDGYRRVWLGGGDLINEAPIDHGTFIWEDVRLNETTSSSREE